MENINESIYLNLYVKTFQNDNLEFALSAFNFYEEIIKKNDYDLMMSLYLLKVPHDPKYRIILRYSDKYENYKMINEINETIDDSKDMKNIVLKLRTGEYHKEKKGFQYDDLIRNYWIKRGGKFELNIIDGTDLERLLQ